MKVYSLWSFLRRGFQHYDIHARSGRLDAANDNTATLNQRIDWLLACETDLLRTIESDRWSDELKAECQANLQEVRAMLLRELLEFYRTHLVGVFGCFAACLAAATCC